MFELSELANIISANIFSLTFFGGVAVFAILGLWAMPSKPIYLLALVLAFLLAGHVTSDPSPKIAEQLVAYQIAVAAFFAAVWGVIYWLVRAKLSATGERAGGEKVVRVVKPRPKPLPKLASKRSVPPR